MKRAIKRQMQRVLEAVQNAKCCLNYALAAGLGVCEPRKLTTPKAIVALLRNRGWRVTAMLPDTEYSKMDIEYGVYAKTELYPPRLKTLSTFSKHFKQGTYLIITTSGPVVLRNGTLFDYEDRGINRRRVASAYRLEPR